MSYLSNGEEVHLEGSDPPDVGELRVVLNGHEEKVDPVEELHARHGGHSHVQEDAEEDGKGNLN